ncbi:MAG: aminoglycoside phosphotransferase family protein [Planctomycetota bacterium]|nr:aminoglycoside phosphotransferase family protein [Planctomycetota bacterium]
MLPIRVRKDLQQLGLDTQSQALIPQAGLSGAAVYRVGTYAIKSHPAASFDRLASVHRQQQRWAQSVQGWIPRLRVWPSLLSSPAPTVLLAELDAPPVHRPAGASLYSCWECMDWLPGIHLETIQEVTPGQQTAVAHALGTLHALAPQAQSPPNGSRDDRMTERNRLLQELLRSNFQQQHRDLERLATQPIPLDLLESIQNALRSAKQIALDCHRAMLQLATQNNTRHWMHGDAWRGNWLFEADGVSGLIDFSQADLRWPGFDFARAFGSMIQGPMRLWMDPWESYCQALSDRGLRPAFRLDEAYQMHRVSTVLTLARYLGEHHLFVSENGPSISRLREVCQQLVDGTAGY